jgi:hypothetical protein
MPWMMGQEEASEPTYAIHVNGLALHEPSKISTVPLLSSGVLPDGLSAHDTLPTGHINGSLLQAVTDLDINVSDSKAGVLPVELSVHDSLPADQINDGILQAVTDLDINVSDAKAGVLPVDLSVHDPLPADQIKNGILQVATDLDINVSDSKTGVLPADLSVHDTLPADQINDGILQPVTGLDINVSVAKTAVLPDGLSVHGTLLTDQINDGILRAVTDLDINVSDSKTGLLPDGLSVHDPLLTNHFTHGILPASGHMDVSDSKHLLTDNQATLLKADMAEAATEWLNHIDNPGHIPINILLNITDDDKTHPRFDGDPAFTWLTGQEANDTWESAFSYKLRNGADPTTGLENSPKLSDGEQADVVININSNYLNSTGWLDPNPGEGTYSVPADKVDMVSELMHEFGHGLGIGITSSLDTTTGTFGAGQKTTWESLLDIEKSGTYFTGSHAIREHGGPVVVTTNTPGENYGHLGNNLSDATDPKTGGPDVMFGVYFKAGQRYEVSDLDVAILQDLGYQAKSPYAVNISDVAHPSWLDTHSLVSTLPETIAIQGDHAPSDLSSGAHTDFSSQTAAHVVAPTFLADEQIAHLQFDTANLAEFAHQLHI